MVWIDPLFSQSRSVTSTLALFHTIHLASIANLWERGYSGPLDWCGKLCGRRISQNMFRTRMSLLSLCNAFSSEGSPDVTFLSMRQVDKICAWNYAASDYLRNREALRAMTRLFFCTFWRKDSGLVLYSFGLLILRILNCLTNRIRWSETISRCATEERTAGVNWDNFPVWKTFCYSPALGMGVPAGVKNSLLTGLPLWMQQTTQASALISLIYLVKAFNKPFESGCSRDVPIQSAVFSSAFYPEAYSELVLNVNKCRRGL